MSEVLCRHKIVNGKTALELALVEPELVTLTDRGLACLIDSAKEEIARLKAEHDRLNNLRDSLLYRLEAAQQELEDRFRMRLAK